MNSETVSRLTTYLRKVFLHTGISLRKRPLQSDSVEMYIDDEFMGLIFVDDEGDFTLEMTILDCDLDSPLP